MEELDTGEIVFSVKVEFREESRQRNPRPGKCPCEQSDAQWGTLSGGK